MKKDKDLRKVHIATAITAIVVCAIIVLTGFLKT